ncbi:MAG: response regulator [Candidatus Stygibacter australis]|nr:response regulator [Candidatus Stygibacter australis]
MLCKKNINVLLLEDNPSDAKLLERALYKRWQNINFLRVFTAEDMHRALSEQEWDIIISDYHMPQFTGLDALDILQESKQDIPFIMVSGKMGEDVAVYVMRAGAQDYILKDKLDRLIPAIERELSEWETRKLNKETKEELRISETAWAKTFSSIADSIMLVNSEGLIKQINTASLDTFNMPESEIIGRFCYDVLELPDKDDCPFRKTKETLKRVQTQISFNNKWYGITLDPIVDESNKFHGAVHIMKDITELMQSRILLETLYNISTTVRSSENLPDLYKKIKQYLIKIINISNIHVALYNEEKDQLTFPFERDIDQNHPLVSQNSLSSFVLKKGKPILFKGQDIRNMAAENIIDVFEPIPLVWLGAPLKTNKKTIGVIYFQSMDDPNAGSEKDLDLISFVSNEIAQAIERKQFEDNLQTALEDLRILHRDLEKKVEIAVNNLREKDHIIMEQSHQASIGEMISSIAHHWRQPLNAIGVTVQSLSEAYEFDELTEDFLNEKITFSMKLLKNLSQSIDDFRFLYQSGKEICDFDLKKYLLKTIDLMKDKFTNSKINLQLELSDSYIITGYPSDFSQAILNVLNNAYEILISRQIEEPKVWVKFIIENDKAVISIRDNGGGIDVSVKDKLFVLYSSTKSNLNNTGIGLYMTKVMIENNMKGTIEVINHQDGAEFIFVI